MPNGNPNTKPAGTVTCGYPATAGGDADGAESDAVLTVELARPIRDPQALYPDLSVAASIFLSVGNEARAGQTLAEAVAGLRELPRLGFAVIELPLQAWVAVTLGRESELIEVLEREPFKSPWLRAGLARRGAGVRANGPEAISICLR